MSAEPEPIPAWPGAEARPSHTHHRLKETP